MENAKITLLTEKQATEQKKVQKYSFELEVFKKYGSKAVLSDFSIITGAFIANPYIFDNNNIPDWTGWYWTKTIDTLWKKFDAVMVNEYTRRERVESRKVANRPVLMLEENDLNSISLNGESLEPIEIEYGQYPQTIADRQIAQTLEDCFYLGTLTETNKEYTIDSRKYDDYDKAFKPLQLKEYQYDGEKYVRVKINSHANKESISLGEYVVLSDGEKYKNDTYVWVKVEPIKWIKEPLKNLFISKKCLFAGVRFNKYDETYDDSKFEETEINYYLQNYFAKDIVSTKINNYQDKDISITPIIVKKTKN